MNHGEEYRGWMLRSVQMATPPGYATPCCVRATCLFEPHGLVGFTREARTAEEAMREVKSEIDSGNVLKRIREALKGRR